jgi:hypothetical protein
MMVAFPAAGGNPSSGLVRNKAPAPISMIAFKKCAKPMIETIVVALEVIEKKTKIIVTTQTKRQKAGWLYQPYFMPTKK